MAVPLGDGALFELRQLIWGSLSGEDVARWFRQEFAFTDAEGLQFGLR
jgi:hypothetical protein